MCEPYALGALDASDRAAFEAHLATGCADCTKALEEARWLVSQLAYLSPEAAPSDMLKGRLMQTVRAEAQAAASSSDSSKKVIPMWMWAGVAALMLLTSYSGWQSHQLQNQIRELQERATAELQNRKNLEQELANKQREAAILTDPASVSVALASSDPLTPSVTAKWHSQLGIVLSGEKIPVPAGTRVLQLWLIPKAAGAKPIPSLTVRPDADGKFDLLVANPRELIGDTKALAITEEPEGGSQQPTTTPRWVGGVS
jgi:anti-sigma-K factor RskA